MSDIKEWADRVHKNIEKVFFGKSDVVDLILTSLLCNGHVLLEDVPGLGKTILARAVSISLGGSFNRIQATPDMLPNDVLGITIYNPSNGEFTFRPGPISGNIILVDEINRATPRTQSAFLEAMAEFQVSIDGVVKKLPDPFFIIATENPVEFEGTYPLPEAQKDRFFMTLNIGYPGRDAEILVLESQRRVDHPINDLEPVSNMEELLYFRKLVVEIHVEESVRNYLLDIIDALRESRFVKIGPSPRGSLALYRGSQGFALLQGRDYVTPEDIKRVIKPIMLQRVVIKTEFSVKGYNVEKVIDEVVSSIPVPPKRS